MLGAQYYGGSQLLTSYAGGAAYGLPFGVLRDAPSHPLNYWRLLWTD